MSRIEITPTIAIDEKDIQFDFVRASGPGGQNVNKVASAVQLRFNLNDALLPDDVRERLVKQAGQRVAGDGTLIIEARRYREQERNRQDALDRLVKMVQRAAQKPKRRRKTKPTRASKEQRLQTKHRRSQTKRWRGPVARSDE